MRGPENVMYEIPSPQDLFSMGFGAGAPKRGTKGDDAIAGDDTANTIRAGQGNDKVHGGDGDDFLFGGRGKDYLVDGWGDDHLSGGRDDDMLMTQFGSDVVKGGQGNDWIESRSDSGEPIIAQNPDGARYYPEEPLGDADDTLHGGSGSDTFYFRLDIDAKAEIAALHTDENGVIDWMGVAGENGNEHDHWVNGIGNDTIKDFKPGQDKIVIEGHTTQAAVEHIDLDDDGTMESTRIVLYSEQGGAGAHQDDKLGMIFVENVLLTDADITTKANVAYGAHETLDDLIDYGVGLYGDDYAF